MTLGIFTYLVQRVFIAVTWQEYCRYGLKPTTISQLYILNISRMLHVSIMQFTSVYFQNTPGTSRREHVCFDKDRS